MFQGDPNTKANLALYDVNIQHKALLYDTSKCTACRGCQVACKQWHNLPAEKTRNHGSYQNPPDLTPRTWLVIRFDEEVDAKGFPVWKFLRQSCFHCESPDCVAVCPPKALTRREDGVVDLDPEKCIGCGYCIDVCPFEVPKMDPKTNKVFKCNFCTDRIDNGLAPSCASVCPTGALRYGDRGKLLEIARERVAYLKGKGFSQASIYGEGSYATGILLVLQYRPEAYSWIPPKPGHRAGAVWWKEVFNPIGSWAIGGAAAAALIHYVLIGPHRIQKTEEKKA